MDDGYCKRLLQPSSEYYYGVLEYTDSCVFDFLMGNADRHHYETYARASRHGRLMHIDNGKRFAILTATRTCMKTFNVDTTFLHVDKITISLLVGS